MPWGGTPWCVCDLPLLARIFKVGGCLGDELLAHNDWNGETQATMKARSHLVPVLSVCMGIGTFSAMDAAMKSAALVVGVYTALLLRNAMATAISVPLWLAAGRPLPDRQTLLVHVQRSVTTAFMAVLFFYGLVRLPMAEGLAISFISPLIALYFAAVMLDERIRRQAILGSLLGIAGIVVIAAGRFGAGQMSTEALAGTLAILGSAIFYALNLVLQRKQATMAGPVEVALFQSGLVALILLPAAPWLMVQPGGNQLLTILIGAALATTAILFLSWGYARAEAQVLVPVEYTGFLWAALLGWWLFDEKVDLATLAGAVLIVIGCVVATRNAVQPTKV